MDVRIGDGSGNEEYRTCAECGRDCEPEIFDVEGSARISFVCPGHGVHAIVDPFEG